MNDLTLERPRVLRSPRRLALASLGLLSVSLGALGVIVPGLPTTVFLIVASWCFTKSCPWLEERVIRNRLFRPYLAYLDGTAGMPRRARLVTIAVMWGSVGLSLAGLSASDRLSAPLAAAVIVAALVGTCCIARLRGAAPEKGIPCSD